MTNETSPNWLHDAALQQFFAAVKEAGGEARAVGGCVRDFLMKRGSGDVDIACTLEPQKLMTVASRHWKVVPTGIDHGTVTVILSGRPVEVTTLRRDVATDGRHATVAYTDKFEEDAARRDFTINAMYMDAHGKIYDYFDGKKDIAAHRVRFIGDANTRIEEDGLRILRFFRFLASFGRPPADQQALEACEKHKHMIENLSGERIAQEMKKLLSQSDPTYALSLMAQIGLPALLTESPWGSEPLRAFLLYEREYGMRGNPWARLLAMIAPAVRAETALWVAERWKLSRIERRVLQEVAPHTTGITSATVKEWLRQHERGVVTARLLLAALDSSEELMVAELMKLARDWEVPKFPVTAKDLLAAGMQEGEELGNKLRALEQKWAESDYALTKTKLLKL